MSWPTGGGSQEGEAVVGEWGGGHLGGEEGEVGDDEVVEGADDGTAGDLGGEGINAAVSEAGKVLAQLRGLGCSVELQGPGKVEVGACLAGGAGEAGVVNVVVDNEDATRGVHDPDATVGDKLAEAVADEEGVEARLPNFASVRATRHVALDEEEVAISMLVVGREVPKLRHPRGDNSVEEATVRVIHTRGGTEVVGATDVDGSLVGKKRRTNGGDDAVGDVVGAAGVRLAGVELRGPALRNRNAELVGNVPAARIAGRIGLTRERGDDDPTVQRAAPYLRRLARYSLKGTMRIALKPFTRSISFWMADFQPKGAA